MCACLLSLTAGCASNSTTVQTVYQQVYVPDHLLAGCPPVHWAGGTYRDLAALAEKRRAALQDCDDRFAAARKYQDDIRAKAKEAASKPGSAR